MDLWETLDKKLGQKKKVRQSSRDHSAPQPYGLRNPPPHPLALQATLRVPQTHGHTWCLLVTGPSHEPGCPAHLNEQAGEFGRQLSSSGLDVVLHQEAHARTPLTAWGSGSERRARQGASGSLLRAAGPCHPFPRHFWGPWPSTTVPTPPPNITSKTRDGSHKEVLHTWL